MQDWIYEQLCEARAPLHELLPSLVEAFVTSLMKAEGVVEAITEEQLTKVFEEQSQADSSSVKDALTIKLLFLYYVLLYEDGVATGLRTSGEFFLFWT